MKIIMELKSLEVLKVLKVGNYCRTLNKAR